MPFFQLAALLQQATAQGSRSTVLRPLTGLIAALGILWLGALEFQAPNWMIVTLFAGVVCVVILFLGTYVYCLLKNPEMLRTEKYSIQKLAIEKGFVGDSLTGLLNEDALKRLVQGQPTEGSSK
jgi:hypothetical protein